MAAGTQDLIFRFLGIDDGAGAEFDRMSGKASMTSSSLRKFGLGAAVAFGVVAAASLDMASKFQASTELIHTNAGATQQEVDNIRKGMLALAGSVGTAPLALSDALFHIESTGQRGANALAELKIAAEGAKVGGSDLTDTANALNATVVSGIIPMGHYSEAMGELNAIVGSGDMHMQDLATALGTGVLPIVKAFGVSLPQAGAALAVFGDNNIRGAKAATALRMAVQALAEPIKTGADALAKLGLTGADAFTHFGQDLTRGGLTLALDDLNTRLHIAGDTGAKTGQILTDAFGKRVGIGLAVLIEEFGRYQLKLAEIAEAGKSFSSDWTATTQTLSFQFDRFRADIDVLLIELGDKLIPVALDTLKVLEEMGRIVVDITGFFERNATVVIALGTAIGTALIPKLVTMAAAFSVDALSAFANGLAGVILKLTGTESALGEVNDEAGLMTGLFNPLTFTLLAAGAAAGYFWEKQREANQKAKAAVDAYVASLHIETNSLASLGSGMEQIQSKITDVDNLTKELSSHGMGLAASLVKNSAASKELTAQYQQYAAQQKTVAFNESKIEAAYGLTRSQVESLAAANNIDLTGSLTSVDNGFAAVVRAANLSMEPLKDAQANFEAISNATSTASQNITALNNAFDDLVGNFIGMKQAQLDFKNDLISTVAALKKSHDSISDNTKAGRTSRAAFLALAAQVETVTTATYTNSKSLDAAKKSAAGMVGQLKALGLSGPVAKRIIAGLTKDVDGMNAAAAAAGRGLGKNLDLGTIQGLQQDAAAVSGKAKEVFEGAIVAAEHATGVASPSTKTRYIGQMLAEGLIQGWTGEASKIKDALTTGLQDALTHLQTVFKNALSQQQGFVKGYESNLKSLLSARKSAISSLQSSIAGNADISNIFGTDANGNPTTGNISQYLSSQLPMIATEARDLALLRKKGLSQALISQISALPPSQAVAAMQQILSGADGSIASLNAQEAAIQKYAKQSAVTTVESPSEKAAIGRDKELVAQGREQERMMRHQIELLEKMAAHQIAGSVTFKLNGSTFDVTKYSDLAKLVKELKKYGLTAQLSA